MHPSPHDFRIHFEPRHPRLPAWLRSLWLWF